MSAMTSYLSANIVPLFILSTGVSRVFVMEGISPADGRGVAHSLQYLESEGFSVLHLGHCVVIVPFVAENRI
jgi:hypothetical protein